jgi:carbamoyl-phosphate synthase large subunit
VAPAFCDIFEQALPTNEPAYLTWLLQTIRKHRVDLLIPGIEIDMYHWVDHGAAIQAAGARVLQNDVALIHLCNDKWTFFEKLSAAGLACTIDSSLSQDFDWLRQRLGLPFLLKPRRGFGSKGIVRVDSEAAFSAFRAQLGTVLMAQPIVGRDDNEFTTSAFCDGQGGLYASMTPKWSTPIPSWTRCSSCAGSCGPLARPTSSFARQPMARNCWRLTREFPRPPPSAVRSVTTKARWP